MKIINFRKEFLLFLLLYFSLLVGFIFNEDSTGGSYNDFVGRIHQTEFFLKDFWSVLYNYDSYGDRHSPIQFFIFTFLKKINIEWSTIRFVNLHLMLLCILFFYKILELKFSAIDKKFLLLIPFIFFLSPSFRSLSIWPDSRLIGFFFFILSTYFFIKSEKHKDLSYVYLNVFFVALASYFSLNFSLFSIYFFYKFYLRFKFSHNLYFILILNIILALPAFYYIFILKIFFMFSAGTPGVNSEEILSLQLNIFNKILIISSIIFFYFIPFVLSKNVEIIVKKIKLSEFLFVVILFIVCIFYFNYQVEFTGGGIFFKFSNIILKNNYFFLLISFISLIYFFLFCKKNFNNFLIFILLLLSNPQLTIYHKYFDPLVFFLIFSLLNIDFKENFFNKKNFSILYVYYSIFLVINLFK